MDKSKLWILEGAAIGVAVILAGVFISRGVNPNLEPAESENPTPVQTPLSEGVKYSGEVPKNAELSIPLETAAVGDGKSELGFFTLKASKSGFVPSTITVKKGNLIQFDFASEDGDYDFFIPANSVYHLVKEGETKKILMQLVDSGTFVFECRDFCPAAGKISGQLIVLPE